MATGKTAGNICVTDDVRVAIVNNIDTASLDIAVTQHAGNSYLVSGRDAPKLYEKMQAIPLSARNLDMGELKDGAFTFKMHDESAMAKTGS